jgi:hypothetical protein
MILIKLQYGLAKLYLSEGCRVLVFKSINNIIKTTEYWKSEHYVFNFGTDSCFGNSPILLVIFIYIATKVFQRSGTRKYKNSKKVCHKQTNLLTKGGRPAKKFRKLQIDLWTKCFSTICGPNLNEQWRLKTSENLQKVHFCSYKYRPKMIRFKFLF